MHPRGDQFFIIPFFYCSAAVTNTLSQPRNSGGQAAASPIPARNSARATSTDLSMIATDPVAKGLVARPTARPASNTRLFAPTRRVGSQRAQRLRAAGLWLAYELPSRGHVYMAQYGLRPSQRPSNPLSSATVPNSGGSEKRAATWSPIICLTWATSMPTVMSERTDGTVSSPRRAPHDDV